MRYFVVAEDGSKFGPADVKLLNAWIGEGRLLPVMTLEEEGSHHQVTAASIEALDFYVLEQPDEPRSAPSGEVMAVTYDQPVAHESEKMDMFIALSMIVLTLILTPFRSAIGLIGLFTALLGLVAAMKMKDRAHESASVVLGLNLAALVIWAIARMYFVMS